MKKRMMILFAVMFVLTISCVYADVLTPSIGTSLDNRIRTIIGLVQMVLFTFVLVLPIYSLIKLIKNQKALDQKYETTETQTKEKWDEYKKEKKKNVLKFIGSIVLAVVLAILVLIIGTMTQTVRKPIIYLYPEEETTVTVNLGKPQNLTCTYPKYTDSWDVVAKQNGDLVDVKTGRNLYALYWEGKETALKKKIKEGFCVKGEDTASFLEEKLAILGLTDREAEEFIVYWLPKLEANKYNLIRFQTKEEIEKNMPLNITPKPDTTIRVMMEWKGVNHYIKLLEQELITPERTGFVAVEWGGTEK